MHFLEKTFLEFFQTSLTVSIVILICFIFMKILTNHIGIRLKYVLLSLIILRLLTPVALHIDVNNIFDKVKKSDISVDTVSETSHMKQNPSTIKDNKQTDISKSQDDSDIEAVNKDLIKTIIAISSIVWVSGAVIIISVITLCSLRFKYKLKKCDLIFDKNINLLSDELKSKLNIKKDIPVYICRTTNSPCISGIIKQKIYVPKFILKLKEEEIEYILLHELIHYKRKDLYFNIITISALSIHWFNPFVWIIVNKMKSYREYACDAGVLEFLGEEKNIGYGMTLINFSKVFISKKDSPKFAMCFETNNKIKERIKMIKGFKKGSYKISARAALGCFVAAAVVFTNGISVSALDVSNLSETSVSKLQEGEEKSNPFLIDEETKCFNDINKVKKYAGFDFKLPDYIGQSRWGGGYQLLKLTDTDNAVIMYYDGQGDRDFGFSLTMFKDEPVKSLEKVLEIKGTFARRENAQCDVSEQDVNYGGVKGKDITLTITTPEQIVDEYTIPNSISTVKYFVWEDNKVYYAINYNNSIEENGHKGSWIDISQDEAGKIADSFKELEEIKNVDYKADFINNGELSTETGIMSIYDKDDLKKAEGILGFNPKMPLKINDNVVIDGSGVGITGDSDVDNKKINYELNLFYNYGDGRITFNQSNHDSFNVYKGIKENGYVDRSDDEWSINKKINADKIDVDGKVVYKYIESWKNPGEDKVSNQVNYEWEDNGVYCSLALFDTDQYQDDLAKEFVNSKVID